MGNKNFKNCCLIVLILVMLLSITACGKEKEAISAEEFKSIMEGLGLTVSDQSNSVNGNTQQYIYVATDMEKYSFEYYYMDSNADADDLYNYAVNGVANSHKDSKHATTVENNNAFEQSYAVSFDDYYVHVAKIQNAVLFVTAYPDYKTESQFIIKKLGF